MCRRHSAFVFVRKSRGGAQKDGRPGPAVSPTFRPFIGISYSSQRLLRETMGHMAKHRRPAKFTKRQASSSPYFMQPGKRGAIIVLHKPGGNRAVPKICGTMP